jgi:transporter family protein
MSTMLATWQFWALLSTTFAALTAIFAKLGDATRAAPLDQPG